MQSFISIHALREEGDPPDEADSPLILDFYPRPPRGGRLLLFFQFGNGILISIHALREEGDPLRGKCSRIPFPFLSTPSARRATLGLPVDGIFGKFLSTPSARRATQVQAAVRGPHRNFYPRPPRGGRLMRRFSCNMA